MTTKKTRTKTTATAWVPQSQAEVSGAVLEIGERQREIARLQADMNDELAKIKERWEALAQPHRLRIELLTAGAHIWCEANRLALTQNGKVKTAQLATGEVGWRTRPPSVRVTGAEVVLETLRRLKLDRFIRQKEEVNKDAILNEPEAVAHVPGISIQQAEDFFITPFEAELAEGTV
ncbi:MAG: host-nuclease inhibitor Gam family protein [Zoogloeaceae bacterium]|jgi:phage host-nuclease inhibitor protein Gam|nr:host-nuclease inhibitor Gam family protein [Zoogloeaceae bacterium]